MELLEAIFAICQGEQSLKTSAAASFLSRIYSSGIVCETPLRSCWLTAALLLLTCVLGLGLRFARLGLPFVLTKYGGSMLWALAIYWLLSAFGRSVPRAGLWAFALAAAVECGKLLCWPPLDAFRRTLTGRLLLGRVFSFRDLLAYAVAIACGLWLDLRLRRTVADRAAGASN